MRPSILVLNRPPRAAGENRCTVLHKDSTAPYVRSIHLSHWLITTTKNPDVRILPQNMRGHKPPLLLRKRHAVSPSDGYRIYWRND